MKKRVDLGAKGPTDEGLTELLASKIDRYVRYLEMGITEDEESCEDQEDMPREVTQLLVEFHVRLAETEVPDFSIRERCSAENKKELTSMMNVGTLARRALAPEIDERLRKAFKIN